MGPDSVAIFSYEDRPYPYFDPRYVSFALHLDDDDHGDKKRNVLTYLFLCYL
jgi:hypothetical protein